jgi:uncharacterized membrane protein YphA (DoxX/SURF4 family)
MKFRDVPTRLATGGYILHSGLEKWRADDTTAEAIHGMASGAYPMLEGMPPNRFLRLLAAGEIAVGAALLLPVVPAAVAGAALTGFSGALMGLYARTPGLRKPGSVWPTHQGMAISKDVWMLGIGVGLLAGSCTARRSAPDTL